MSLNSMKTMAVDHIKTRAIYDGLNKNSPPNLIYVNT